MDQEKTPQQSVALYWLAGLGLIAGAILSYFYFTDSPLSAERILALVEGWYARYGYATVFIAAFLEGLFPFNLYIPGSSSIVVGIVFAQRTGLSIPIFTALIIAGFFLAYCINYITGRYGVYKLLTKLGYGESLDAIQKKLKTQGPKILFGALFHSNLGSTTTTAAGVMKLPVLQYLGWTLLGVVFWDVIWVVSLSLVGEQLVDLAGSWLIIPVLLVWGLIAYFFLPKLKGDE